MFLSLQELAPFILLPLKKKYKGSPISNSCDFSIYNKVKLLGTVHIFKVKCICNEAIFLIHLLEHF